MKQKAFTLVELLIIIAVMAILAVITIAALNPAARLLAANNVQRRNNVQALSKAVELYEVDNVGQLPTAGGAELPNVTLATLASDGADASTLDGIIGTYIDEFPSLPANTTYYIGIESSTGLPIIGTGIVQSDGSSTLFTGRYGLSDIVVDEAVSEEEGGGGGGMDLGINTPYNFVLVDSNCNELISVADGGTYQRGTDFTDVKWNIRFEFSDPDYIRYTAAQHQQHTTADGTLIRDTGLGYDGRDVDGTYLMFRDDCSDGAINTIKYSNRGDVINSFSIRIVNQDDETNTYDFSFTILAP